MSLASILFFGGTALSAGGTYYAASEKSKAADFNAQLAEETALQEEESAQREETQFRKQARQFTSMQQTLFATAGIRLDEGSALDVMSESIEELELDALTIRAGGKARSTYFRNQAASDRRAGNTALITGTIAAGSSLLSGYSDYKWGR